MDSPRRGLAAAAPLVPVWEVDVLMFATAALALRHAIRHRELRRYFTMLLAGLVCEVGSIRGGGTHCHADGLFNLYECSSVNSVLFYAPWLYSATVAAERLGQGGPRWAVALWAGVLAFLMCGVYEI